jgi:hypothetical protein
VLKHTLTLLQSSGSYLNICILIFTYSSQVRVQLLVRLLGKSTTLELQFLVGVYLPFVRSKILATMMKISIALLALLALAFLSEPVHVEALTDNTWVNNLSSKGLVSSITYQFPLGHPGFTNRVIAPGSAGECFYHIQCYFTHASFAYGRLFTLDT